MQKDGLMFIFSGRRRHTRSVSAFLLNRSSDLKVKMSTVESIARPRRNGERRRAPTASISKESPAITGVVEMVDRKSGSAGMPRPISYAVFCLKKKNHIYLVVEEQLTTSSIGVRGAKIR